MEGKKNDKEEFVQEEWGIDNIFGTERGVESFNSTYSTGDFIFTVSTKELSSEEANRTDVFNENKDTILEDTDMIPIPFEVIPFGDGYYFKWDITDPFLIVKV